MKYKFPCSILIILLFGAYVAQVEAQRGRGGRRGGMGGGGNSEQFQRMRGQAMALRAFPVERLWSGLSFGIEMPDSQLTIIRPIIQDAWSKRKDILEVASQDKTWKLAKEVLGGLNKEIKNKLDMLLTKDQNRKLKKLMKKTDYSKNLNSR